MGGGSDARGGADGSDAADAAGAPDVHVVQTSFAVGLNRMMDILFVVDDSPSMAPLQNQLAAQFPVFVNQLKGLPTGDGTLPGLPDLHLALVSTDTGPGKYDEPVVQCPFGGDRGNFRSMPTATCAATPLLSDQRFLSEIVNQIVDNYTGDISDAFTCIVALGEQGCGFGAPLKSLRWALDPTTRPPGNEGFLRPDAGLAVIVLANQDDCSVPDDSDLFDQSAAGVSAYGPFKRFRCNEFGHLCDVNGNGTLQPPPATGAANNLQGCISNDTATGKLTHIADEVAFLKSLKGDPSQIFVAAITGPATPYSVASDAAGDDGNVDRRASSTASAAAAGRDRRSANAANARDGDGGQADQQKPTRSRPRCWFRHESREKHLDLRKSAKKLRTPSPVRRFVVTD